MENNLNRRSIGSHDDELRDTSVEGLGSFVSSLLELAKMGSLLDNVQDLLSEISVSQRESTSVGGRHGYDLKGSLQNNSGDGIISSPCELKRGRRRKVKRRFSVCI